MNTALNLQLEMVENKGGCVDMCTAQKILGEWVRREETENGRAEGIRGLINALKRLGHGVDDIRAALMENFASNEHDAEAYLKQALT